MKLKKLFIITFLVMFLIFSAGFAAADASRKPVITADKTYFDVSTGLYVLDGNVRVEVRGRTVTANHAKISISRMEVFGKGNIDFHMQDMNFKGGSVYVYGSQKLAKIDGGVVYTATGITATSDRAEYNWETKIAILSGNVKVNQNGKTWETDRAVYNMDTKTFVE